MPDAELALCGERAAVIERILAERRRMRVEASIALQPPYLVNAIGHRPDGVRGRLEWERGVDRIERLRQRLGVRDPERALGSEPSDAHARAVWRQAQREIELVRAHISTRAQERVRAASIGLAGGLGR